MTWKIPANYPSLESFCTDQWTKLTGNNNANYIHLLIRAIAGHPLETKVFREERSNAKIQVERETAKDVCTIFSRVVFPFAIRMGWPRVVVVSCLNSIRGPSWLACYIGQLFVWKRARCSLPPPFPYFHHYSIACDFFDRKNFCKNCPTSLERKIDR